MAAPALLLHLILFYPFQVQIVKIKTEINARRNSFHLQRDGCKDVAHFMFTRPEKIERSDKNPYLDEINSSMRSYFSFNTQTHNFWPVYEAIKTYYPIGIRYSYPSLYTEYEGQKKFGQLLADHFQNMENFRTRYESFTNKLQDEFGLEVQGTSHGQQPCFSFDMILKKTELQGVTKISQLSAAVSLLGDFYTIFGIDKTILKEERDPFPYNYQAVNVITASPYKEFEEHFLKLKQIILERYPNYKQVPFAILTAYFHGLYNRFDETDESTVYNALFNQLLEPNYPYNIRGDKYYGFDEWRNEGITDADLPKVEVFAPPMPDQT